MRFTQMNHMSAQLQCNLHGITYEARVPES